MHVFFLDLCFYGLLQSMAEDFAVCDAVHSHLWLLFLSSQSRSLLVDSASTHPLPRCFELMSDIAKGLAALHERDIVHRDLKVAH